MEPHSHHDLFQNNGTFRLPQALTSLLKTYLAAAGERSRTNLSLQHLKSCFEQLPKLWNPLDTQGCPDHTLTVGMVTTAVLCGTGIALWNLAKGRAKIATDKNGFKHAADKIGYDVAGTDPGLLKKYSTMREYTVPATGFTYSGIRTYYQPHTHENKLPQTPTLVPLLVFIHGLGGSTAQFYSILSSLTNIATCLAIDLPGCGVSIFDPAAWEAYTTGSLVHLLATVINAHRDVDQNQQVVLVGHSLGCSLAVMLTSPTSPYAHLLHKHVAGLAALCPQAQPPDAKHQRSISIATWTPTLLFDQIRKRDRKGGVNSASVARMAGPDADEETKKLQLRFNEQSRSDVWKRMARGMLGPLAVTAKPTSGGLPGQSIWAGLRIPVLLVAGAADTITPASNVNLIVKLLESKDKVVIAKESSSEKARSSMQHPIPVLKLQLTPITSAPPKQAKSVKQVIIPSPAAHSLIFTPGPTHHALLGHLNSFLAKQIDIRLDSSWQLKYFTTEGKWDVKNLEKWQAVAPVSLPIAETFRALKTLRGVDPTHCPRIFVKEWAGKLKAVLDISHDTPVYDPKELVQGGLPYYKFPTVSKQAPSKEEVKKFCAMVEEIQKQVQGEGLVGVHCHYGYNRTGFFLVSYMVERLGYSVQDAVEEFKVARYPGIRHEYFVHELHARYQT